jgi:hypothetical protein
LIDYLVIPNPQNQTIETAELPLKPPKTPHPPNPLAPSLQLGLHPHKILHLNPLPIEILPTTHDSNVLYNFRVQDNIPNNERP